MNIEKNLIMIKDEDKTEKIQFCQYKKIVEKFEVTFNDSKVEYYDSQEIHWLKTPVEVNIENKIVYENHRQVINTKKVIKFGSYYRLIYKNGHNQVFESNELEFEESILMDKQLSEKFNELKAAIVHTMDKENEKELINQLNNIKYVSPKSALAYYLKSSNNEEINDDNNLIYPFGFNINQIESLNSAFKSKISILDKINEEESESTILNVIANAVIKDKSIAVVSEKSIYIEKVYEKLSDFDLSFMVAALGVNHNNEMFLCNDTCVYSNMAEWRIKTSIQNVMYKNSDEVKAKIINKYKKVDKLLEQKKSLINIRDNKSSIKKELYLENKINTKMCNMKSIDKLLVELNNKNDNISFGEKLRYAFKYGIYDFRLYNNSIDNIKIYLECLRYEREVNELTKEIQHITMEVDTFNNNINDYCNIAVKLLKSKIAKRYSHNKVRPVFIEDDLKKNFQKVIKEFPVILSKTKSLKSCIPDNYLFDYLVIKSTEPIHKATWLIILSSTRNIILVGEK